VFLRLTAVSGLPSRPTTTRRTPFASVLCFPTASTQG